MTQTDLIVALCLLTTTMLAVFGAGAWWLLRRQVVASQRASDVTLQAIARLTALLDEQARLAQQRHVETTQALAGRAEDLHRMMEVQADRVSTLQRWSDEQASRFDVVRGVLDAHSTRLEEMEQGLRATAAQVERAQSIADVRTAEALKQHEEVIKTATSLAQGIRALSEAVADMRARFTTEAGQLRSSLERLQEDSVRRIKALAEQTSVEFDTTAKAIADLRSQLVTDAGQLHGSIEKIQENTGQQIKALTEETRIEFDTTARAIAELRSRLAIDADQLHGAIEKVQENNGQQIKALIQKFGADFNMAMKAIDAQKSSLSVIAEHTEKSFAEMEARASAHAQILAAAIGKLGGRAVDSPTVVEPPSRATTRLSMQLRNLSMRVELTQEGGSSAPATRFLVGVTHSDRPFDIDRCTSEFYKTRFGSPGRLLSLPPFFSLKPARAYAPYAGGASFWIYDPRTPDEPRLLCHFNPGYRVQHAVPLGEHFLLAGPEFVELVSGDGQTLWHASDPWMAGVHTVFHHNGRVAVSCSASDAVIVLDASNGAVTHALRLPLGVYGGGGGYLLERDHDVREHFIVNDHQMTHINCAWPCEEGIYISTLIHGVVGLFGWDSSYRELFRAPVGSHGVRRIAPGRLLLADSCAGVGRVYDMSGNEQEHFDFGCRLLHDIDIADGRFVLGTSTDLNVLMIADRTSGKILARWPMQFFGAGVQFLSVTPLTESPMA